MRRVRRICKRLRTRRWPGWGQRGPSSSSLEHFLGWVPSACAGGGENVTCRLVTTAADLHDTASIRWYVVLVACLHAELFPVQSLAALREKARKHDEHYSKTIEGGK